MRERGTAPGVGVETVEFDIDPASVAGPPEGLETDEPGAPSAAVPSPSARRDLDDGGASDLASPQEPSVADPAQDVQTLGELLQQAREDRGLTLEAASARTRISTLMLRHLENDRFGEFAADAYVKGFLRNYGSFLGLDVGMLLRRYETISGRVVERDPEVLELDTQPWRRRHRKRGRLGWVVLALLVAAALAWVFWRQGAARLGLRTKPGLEQIEEELRESTPPLSVPGLVPAQPSILLPEAGSPAPSAAPSGSQATPGGNAGLPASDLQPLPFSPTPRPLSPTERRDSAPPGQPSAPPPSSDSIQDLVPKERP